MANTPIFTITIDNETTSNDIDTFVKDNKLQHFYKVIFNLFKDLNIKVELSQIVNGDDTRKSYVFAISYNDYTSRYGFYDQGCDIPKFWRLSDFSSLYRKYGEYDWRSGSLKDKYNHDDIFSNCIAMNTEHNEVIYFKWIFDDTITFEIINRSEVMLNGENHEQNIKPCYEFAMLLNDIDMPYVFSHYINDKNYNVCEFRLLASRDSSTFKIDSLFKKLLIMMVNSHEIGKMLKINTDEKSKYTELFDIFDKVCEHDKYSFCLKLETKEVNTYSVLTEIRSRDDLHGDYEPFVEGKFDFYVFPVYMGYYSDIYIHKYYQELHEKKIRHFSYSNHRHSQIKVKTSSCSLEIGFNIIVDENCKEKCFDLDKIYFSRLFMISNLFPMKKKHKPYFIIQSIICMRFASHIDCMGLNSYHFLGSKRTITSNYTGSNENNENGEYDETVAKLANIEFENLITSFANKLYEKGCLFVGRCVYDFWLDRVFKGIKPGKRNFSDCYFNFDISCPKKFTFVDLVYTFMFSQTTYDGEVTLMSCDYYIIDDFSQRDLVIKYKNHKITFSLCGTSENSPPSAYSCCGIDINRLGYNGKEFSYLKPRRDYAVEVNVSTIIQNIFNKKCIIHHEMLDENNVKQYHEGKEKIDKKIKELKNAGFTVYRTKTVLNII